MHPLWVFVRTCDVPTKHDVYDVFLWLSYRVMPHDIHKFPSWLDVPSARVFCPCIWVPRRKSVTQTSPSITLLTFPRKASIPLRVVEGERENFLQKWSRVVKCVHQKAAYTPNQKQKRSQKEHKVVCCSSQLLSEFARERDLCIKSSKDLGREWGEKQTANFYGSDCKNQEGGT